jgi:hypothetical protein
MNKHAGSVDGDIIEAVSPRQGVKRRQIVMMQ